MRCYKPFHNCFPFFQDTSMEQLLLMRWVFDLLFYSGCLCDLQKKVLNPKSEIIPSSSFLFSDIMELSLILVFTFSCENSIWLFLTIVFHVVKVKPFKKNVRCFRLLQNNLIFVSIIRCSIISVTGYCDIFQEIK